MQNYMTPISNPLSPKLEAMIKNLTTPQLLDLYKRQATNPNPDLKLTMILGELKNREDLDQKMQQAPTSTVAQDVVQKAAPQPAMPPQGIQQLQPQQPQTQPGIANLPVPDTMFQEQSMAGGGIVSFDEGGRVPGFAVGGLPSQLDPNYTAVIEGYKAAVPGLLAKARSGKPLEQNELQILQFLQKEGKLPFSASAFFTAEPRIPASVQSKIDRLTPSESQQTAGPDFETVGKMVGSDLLGAAGKQKAPSAGTGITQPRGPSIEGGLTPYKVTPYTPETVPLTQAQAELEEAQKQAGTWEEFSGRAAQRREAAGIKDVYAQQMADIQAEKQKVAGDKEKAGWMAALEAGLAITAGSSPYALQNLGVGALKGVSSYKDALKEINQNEKELRKEGNALQRDQQTMLEARLRGDETSYQAALDRVQGRRDKIQGIEAQNTLIRNAGEQYNATAKTEASKTAFTQTQENKRAQAHINATLEAARISSTGALYRAMMGAQMTPKDRADIEARFEKSYSDYLSTAGKEPISREAYRAIFMKNIGNGGGGYTPSGSFVPGEKDAGYAYEYKLPSK